MNAGPEPGVPQVEVEAGHPPVGLGEREPRHAVTARPGHRGEHVLVLRATPVAATPDRPVAACAATCRRITSILRSALPNRTTGMCSASANVLTARRNAVPIFPMIAGDGIGQPRCCVMNDTTWPPTCRFGT